MKRKKKVKSEAIDSCFLLFLHCHFLSHFFFLHFPVYFFGAHTTHIICDNYSALFTSIYFLSLHFLLFFFVHTIYDVQTFKWALTVKNQRTVGWSKKRRKIFSSHFSSRLSLFQFFFSFRFVSSQSHCVYFIWKTSTHSWRWWRWALSFKGYAQPQEETKKIQ